MLNTEDKSQKKEKKSILKIQNLIFYLIIFKFLKKYFLTFWRIHIKFFSFNDGL